MSESLWSAGGTDAATKEGLAAGRSAASAPGVPTGKQCLGRQVIKVCSDRLRLPLLNTVRQHGVSMVAPQRLSVPYVSGHWLSRAGRTEDIAARRGQARSITPAGQGLREMNEALAMIGWNGALPESLNNQLELKDLPSRVVVVDGFMSGKPEPVRSKFYLEVDGCPPELVDELAIVRQAAGTAQATPQPWRADRQPMYLMALGNTTEAPVTPEVRAAVGELVMATSIILRPMRVYYENIR